jgi:hypothetical protein
MTKLWFAISWGFILAAASYDGYFAWHYRAVIESWELNPFALWVAANCGLGAVVLFKACGTLFAASLAWYCRRRHVFLGRGMTAIIAAAYALLAVHYVVGFHEPTYQHQTYPQQMASAIEVSAQYRPLP